MAGGEIDGRPASTACPLIPSFVRAFGELRAEFSRIQRRTQAVRTYEHGGLRLRFPHAQECEGVIINTGGGIAGGDRARLRFALGESAAVMLTTQSAEKVYRSEGPTSEVELALVLGKCARLEWLPQETILFDSARLLRRLDVEMAADAHLTLLDTLVFGRLAMGETRPTGYLRDRWRVRRGGELVFAEEVALDGDIAALLDRRACGGGARMTATLLQIAPGAEENLDRIRSLLDGGSGDPDVECGASAWNGLLVTRMISPSPTRLRRVLVRLLEGLRGRSAPRVWQ